MSTERAEGKELILDVTGAAPTDETLQMAKGAGVTRLLRLEKSSAGPRFPGFAMIGPSDAETLLVPAGEGDASSAAWIEIKGPVDMRLAIDSASTNAMAIVKCADWKIIPLENLVGEFRRKRKKLYVWLDDLAEAKLSMGILEKGVDGVVLPIESFVRGGGLNPLLGYEERCPLVKAVVRKVVDIALGDRVCVDTASSLSLGQGMLVGSSSSFFFFVHSETVQSGYIPTRPFRVNAGAIHSYLLGFKGKTVYLSELKGGDEVMIVSAEGSVGSAAVGRVKMERRPLVMIVARAGESEGSVMLQKAETVRLVKGDGSLVATTDVKEGDEILVHITEGKGRHFGQGVDEFVVER
jgi:3-dehydroquinate synthase II